MEESGGGVTGRPESLILPQGLFCSRVCRDHCLGGRKGLLLAPLPGGPGRGTPNLKSNPVSGACSAPQGEGCVGLERLREGGHSSRGEQGGRRSRWGEALVHPGLPPRRPDGG